MVKDSKPMLQVRYRPVIWRELERKIHRDLLAYIGRYISDPIWNRADGMVLSLLEQEILDTIWREGLEL